MPRSVRLSVQKCARLALLVSTVVFAVVAALVTVDPPASSACPIPMPKPLRVLYMESKLVAVGRVGDSVTVEQKQGGALVRTPLRISSILKGESKEKVVNFDHYVWSVEDVSSPHSYSKDDVVLVFLIVRDEGDGYVPADYQRGVKKLSPDDLKIYVRRIEELAAITRSAEHYATAVTEWLVRCAEEPATRWEGAFELALNATMFQDPPEDETLEAVTDEDEAEAVPDDEASEEEVDESGSSVEQVGAGATGADNVNSETANAPEAKGADVPILGESVQFVPYTTPEQNERLLMTLLGAEELGEGELMLLRAVGSLKDARVVPFLLKHLARTTDKPDYAAEDMMRIVAHTLGDQTLIKFVANYSKTVSYNDLYNDAIGIAEIESSAISDEDRAALKKTLEEMKATAAESRFQRSGKVQHFLALAAQPQTP
ncbi:MAG TPA: hypothetical protein VJ842_10240 [Pyrinomonadaceae bacterium]|nr:hypothetical protein [Pyrinomonadaceae bacterium]